MSSQPFSPRVKVDRLPQRGAYDRATIHAILDEGLLCHVGFMMDQQPYVIPMAYARRKDTLLLHGASSSRLMQALGEGVPVCVTVTHLDGLVLARSALNHSMNYRSVVVLGKARPVVDGAEKRQALRDLVEHLIPGRSEDIRGASDAEMGMTAVVELSLDEASAKLRSGPPGDLEMDMGSAAWAGEIPLRTLASEPVDAPDLDSAIEAPAYVRNYGRPCTDEKGQP